MKHKNETREKQRMKKKKKNQLLFSRQNIQVSSAQMEDIKPTCPSPFDSQLHLPEVQVNIKTIVNNAGPDLTVDWAPSTVGPCKLI